MTARTKKILVSALLWAAALLATVWITTTYARVDGNRWDDGNENRKYDAWKRARLAELTPRIVAFEEHWIVVLPRADSFLDEYNERVGFAFAAKLTEIYRRMGFSAITFENCVWNWLQHPIHMKGGHLYSCLPWNLWDGRYVEPTPTVIDFMVDAAEHERTP